MSSRLIELERQVAALHAVCRRLISWRAVLEDRMDKTIRHGKVTDVDTEKHLARLEVANKDGTTTKSPWRPYAQVAGPDGGGAGQGEFKFHNPPAVGQQMTFFSPNGEWRQGIILPFTWHDSAQSPSTKSDEHVITYGKLTITHKKDLYDIKLDQAEVQMQTGLIKASIGDSRAAITPAIAKLRKGGAWVVVDGGEVIASSPPIIGADPDSN
jgi:phage baseplate assembly protein gpV